MKTLYMTKGLPASGKSTWAKRRLELIGPGNGKIVNKDQLRAMLDNGHWSKGNENFVLQVRDFIIIQTLKQGLHVIVDDTNLAPRHESALRGIAKNCNAAFELVSFLDVSLEECLARDRKRPNYVGEAVIMDMWSRYLAPTVSALSTVYDPTLPDAIIVDMDGTLAEMGDRNPYDWSAVYEDSVRGVVADMVTARRKLTGAAVLVVSGRDRVCEDLTRRWLDEKCWPLASDGLPPHLSDEGHPYQELWMRPAGDMRKDAIVKQEIYEQHIKGRYNVIAIFDDRPQMIRAWQSMGFGDRIFNVGSGREF